MKNDTLLLAVNGTLMRGLALENNLKSVGAHFIKETKTAPCYRLFSINNAYPAMIKDEKGASIALELYEISAEGMQSVLSKEPEGLTIEKITLIDQKEVYGVTGLPFIIENRKEITSFGGWRNYIKQMKKLFIYYSYTGNGEIVANNLKEEGIDIRKAETLKRSLPKSFFWGMMSGGFQAAIKKKAKLKEFDYDISAYDEVIIGSPIWNGRFPPAINTILANLKIDSQSLSFILYSGSGTAPKAIKRINKEYKNSQYIVLKEPKKYPEELEKIK